MTASKIELEKYKDRHLNIRLTKLGSILNTCKRVPDGIYLYGTSFQLDLS